MSLEGRRLGPYILGELLGRGGMGEVYRASDARLGRDVAIKVLPTEFTLDPDRLSRFQREARALAALNHPNIAAIYGIEESAELRGLVLELVDGETVASRLSRGAMPVPEAIATARQVAEALESAHEKGIVHRDLKPANLHITSGGTIKVLDFGLAKAVKQRAADVETIIGTSEGAVLGTAPYMSPEQARGLDTDQRTDIWAFGCLLYELLAGRPPFRGHSAPDILADIVSRDPDLGELPAATPPGVRRLIERCLQKDPRQRLRDIGDARIDLQSAGREPDPETRKPFRVWPPLTAAALFAMAVAAAVWVAMRPGIGDGAPPLAFTIDPPDGVAWGDLPPDPQPVISPDGHKVAFVGRSAEGPGIWIRELTATEARRVPGSTDAPENVGAGSTLGLFWSSDSTRVGYCARGKLKLTGPDSQPQIVLDAGCTAGSAAWNADGDILFARADGLFRISEHGGAPVRVTTSKPGVERMHSFPRWLPDGRRFIYTALSLDTDSKSVYIATIDGPSRRIAEADSKTDFVIGQDGTSYLVFVKGATLMLQPLGSSMMPAGKATILATQIGNGGPGAMPSFSASSTLLVYRTMTRSSAWVWVDRQGRALGRRHGGQTMVTAAALSRDETTLVYGRRDPDTLVVGLWLADVVHQIEEPFVTAATIRDLPAFSRDGRRIAFSGAEQGVLQLFVQDFPKGAPARLATGIDSGLSAPIWSADGQALLASRGGRIVLVPLDRPAEITTVVAEGQQPQLSPDGNWLAYTASTSGVPEVYVQRFASGADRRRVSIAGGFQPQWRGDGTELYYLTADGAMMSVPVRKGVRFDAGQPTQLFRERFRSDGASPLRRDYLPTRNGERFLLNLQTSGPVPLTAVRNWLNHRPQE